MRSGERRSSTWDPRRWSLGRQLLLLQVVLLSLVVTLGFAGLYTETRRDTEERARSRVLAVAETLATSPYVLAQVQSQAPARTLSPYAESVRRRIGVDFVVVMAPDRTRFSHPDPTQIGRPFIGTIEPALAGRSFTETFTGTLGPSVRAVAPVQGPDGRVVALVAVGITTEVIGRDLARQVPTLLLLAALALGVAVAGAALVSRRLRRQTHGLGPVEITRMYEYYDAVLHSVREGLVVLDQDRRVALVNDEARRLLGLGDRDVVGEPATALNLPAPLAETLSSGEPVSDALHLAGDRVVVINQSRALWEGRSLGTVTTLRDHTELAELTGELDSTRAFAESLRSQAHEAANRLHTVVSLIETGRAAEAVEFATAELELAQELTDRLMAALEEPVLAALLLGKAAQAHERGVELRVTDDSAVGRLRLPARDIVTVLGNLVDNALDAAAEGSPPRRVTVRVHEDGEDLVISVADTGPGLEPNQLSAALQRGWSTKTSSAPYGRGLGLALVEQVVRRHAGRLDVSRDIGAVFTVRLPQAVYPRTAGPLSADAGQSDAPSAWAHDE